MRSTFTRFRAPSQSHHLKTHPPPTSSIHYSPSLAALAARILYKSPLPSRADLPVYILDAAAFPDAKDVDYDILLPYVLARLPGEEELIGGVTYEIVFFAGGTGDARGRNSSTSGPAGAADAVQNGNKGNKKSRPGWSWFLQAYQVLTRATRKRLMRLYVVHEKGWIRVVMEMFATIVSPKVRKKVVHVNTLTSLALQIPIEDLLIPPSAYFTDRRKIPDIFAPYASGKRAFGVKHPLPIATDGTSRIPRVLREATSFLLTDSLPKMDGIFRVSARAQTVEILKEAYDRGQKFIVWKEGDTMVTYPHYQEGAGTVTIDELDEIDGYDVHSAAAIIKLWYHELREPIFPQSTYQALQMFHSDPTPPTSEQLQQILSPGTEYSPLPSTSSKILTMHLLPLLSRIAEHSESNRMTPVNLAVCFAPNCVCGPDPMEDVRMSAIVQRLLVAMITNWKAHLAPVLGLTDEIFAEALRMPQAIADREDPLEEVNKRSGASTYTSSAVDGAEQVNGIALLDNDHDSGDSSSEEDEVEEGEGERPALPPRPRTSSPATLPSRSRTDSLAAVERFTTNATSLSPVKRKPTANSPEGLLQQHQQQQQQQQQQQEDEQDSNIFTPIMPAMSTISPTSTASPSSPTTISTSITISRKPAPAVATLPRYSTLITNRPAVLAALQQYNQSYNTGEDGTLLPEHSQQHHLAEEPESSHAEEDLPTYEQSTPVLERERMLTPIPGPSSGDTDGEERRPPPLLVPEKVKRKPVGDGEGKGGG